MSGDYMSIDLKNITANQTDSTANRTASRSTSDQGTDTTPANAGQSSAPQDSVVLSDQAQVVQSLISTLSQAPESDTQRIEQLRNAINSGEYSVSAEKIASKMLTLDFGHRNQG